MSKGHFQIVCLASVLMDRVYDSNSKQRKNEKVNRIIDEQLGFFKSK